MPASWVGLCSGQPSACPDAGVRRPALVRAVPPLRHIRRSLGEGGHPFCHPDRSGAAFPSPSKTTRLRHPKPSPRFTHGPPPRSHFSNPCAPGFAAIIYTVRMVGKSLAIHMQHQRLQGRRQTRSFFLPAVTIIPPVIKYRVCRSRKSNKKFVDS